MDQYYKAGIKLQVEDDKGRLKFRRENYIILAVSPTDVEEKLAKHLGNEDYEIMSITLNNITDILE